MKVFLGGVEPNGLKFGRRQVEGYDQFTVYDELLRLTMQDVVEFVFVADDCEEVAFYLLSVLYSLNLKFLSVLGYATDNPSTGGVREGTDGAPGVGRELGFGGLGLKVIPFDILYFGYEIFFTEVHIGFF